MQIGWKKQAIFKLTTLNILNKKSGEPLRTFNNIQTNYISNNKDHYYSKPEKQKQGWKVKPYPNLMMMPSCKRENHTAHRIIPSLVSNGK